MSYFEVVGNLHMHTPYSDGEAYHTDIAQAAITAKLDFVVVTDHNCRVNGVQGYYGDESNGYMLLLTGEEVHDRTRHPQVNHCLVYNIEEEMVSYTSSAQGLIDNVKARDGLSFLAHPFDRNVAWTRSLAAIHWQDWDISDFTGLEIWNYMSVFKDALSSPLQTLRFMFRPEAALVAPRQATLDKWDALLAEGKHVVGIGGSDAHGSCIKVGLLRTEVFPYEFLFRCINTHLLLKEPFSGNWREDEQNIYTSLREGLAFISYGLVGDAHGFRFTAQGSNGISVHMGQTIKRGNGVTLQIISPDRGRIKLIHHGTVVKEAHNIENLSFNALEKGAYRVEVWKSFKGKERCWILSNPIYVE